VAPSIHLRIGRVYDKPFGLWQQSSANAGLGMPTRQAPGRRLRTVGGGITADQMSKFRWTKPQVVSQVRFLE
jgi:hypothetical protein